MTSSSQNILIVAPHGRTTKFLTLQLLTENPNELNTIKSSTGMEISSHRPTITPQRNHISCTTLHLFTRSKKKTLSKLQSLFTHQYLNLPPEAHHKESLIEFLNGKGDTIRLSEDYEVRVVWREGDCLDELREMYAAHGGSSVTKKMNSLEKVPAIRFDSAIVCISTNAKHENDLIQEICGLIVSRLVCRMIFVSTSFVEHGYSLPAMLLNTFVPLVVHYKLLAENAIRKACRSVKCPYFIIRPVGLSDKVGLHKQLHSKKDDNFRMFSKISRQDVASVCVSCLYMHKFVTFGVESSKEDRDKPEEESTTAYLQRSLIAPMENDDFYLLHANHIGGRNLFVGVSVAAVSVAGLAVTGLYFQCEPAKNALSRIVSRISGVFSHFRD